MALSSPSDDNMYESEKDDAFTSNVSSPMSDGPVPGIDSPEGETPEEKERRMAELKEELDKVESEINMLRQVLGSKVRHATELKRKLGITPFQEFKSDISSGLQQIKSSDSYQKTNETISSQMEKISNTSAYQKTSAVMKTAGDKTSSALGAVGSVMSKKMGEIKNSSTFKSFDERVHTTYASVKTMTDKMQAKVTGSRSSQDIDEAFRDAQIAEDGVVEAGATEGSGEGDEKKVPL